MPVQPANGVNLYYEVHGTGPALVLFMGLGGNVAMWDPEFIEALSRRFRVLIFDNRGTGRSDKPDHPYSIKLFADDAAALIAGLGIGRAHILGASMGGMIAQEFVLDYPGLVDRLVLCCTMAGGAQAIAPELEVLISLANTEGLPPAEASRCNRRFAFHPKFLAAHEDYLEWKLPREVEFPTPPFALAHHFDAAVQFDVAERVTTIRHPTLVLVGREDQMVPAANSVWLAQHVPTADLIVYGTAGHGFLTERRDDALRDIIQFLAAERCAGIDEEKRALAGATPSSVDETQRRSDQSGRTVPAASD